MLPPWLINIPNLLHRLDCFHTLEHTTCYQSQATWSIIIRTYRNFTFQLHRPGLVVTYFQTMKCQTLHIRGQECHGGHEDHSCCAFSVWPFVPQKMIWCLADFDVFFPGSFLSVWFLDTSVFCWDSEFFMGDINWNAAQMGLIFSQRSVRSLTIISSCSSSN